MNGKLVSVIVPTFNNQDTIAVCLESIEQQTYDQIETIVVDGGSCDLTTDICRRYEVNLVVTELGRAAARTRGAERASGDLLLHVDSDMELTPNVVKECVEQSSTFDALIIPETNIGDSYWARCTDVGKTVSRRRQVGNLRFLPRELYFEVGAHNPELLAKEDEELHDLVRSAGASIGFTESLIHHHVGDIGLFEILSRRWTYIRSLPAYDRHSRIGSQLPESDSSESIASILLEETKRRPTSVAGYLILQVTTALLLRVNRII